MDYIIKDPLRQSVEAASGGRNTVLYDALGYPNYMCVIPKFNLEDVDTGFAETFGTGPHPAFSVMGKEKSEIFIGMYQSTFLGDGTVTGSVATSIPGVDPLETQILYDDARIICGINKGPGWHMMTNWEWAAIALWCFENGTMPRGNNDFGRSYSEPHETGRIWDSSLDPGDDPGSNTWSNRVTTLTGSGPPSWRHDNTFNGIADLAGNTWEYMEGIKIEDSVVYMPVDNYYGTDETLWQAVEYIYVTKAPLTGYVFYSTVAPAISETTTDICDWDKVLSAAPAAHPSALKLKQAALTAGGVPMVAVPPREGRVKGAIDAPGSGVTRIVVRGGAWYLVDAAGLLSYNFEIDRATIHHYTIRPRVAFIA